MKEGIIERVRPPEGESRRWFELHAKTRALTDQFYHSQHKIVQKIKSHKRLVLNFISIQIFQLPKASSVLEMIVFVG